MRIIAATRLSRLDESTASPEAQAESLRDYANRNAHIVIAETSDLDVSGGKPIRQRPGVGAWLTGDHLDEWDAIAGYSVDRMFRNLYDFVTFWHDFLEPNGKGLIITSENIDMSTPDGRMMAQLRVVMAENELNKIAARNKRSADYFRKQGLWHGGQVPFGYKPKRQGNHFILVIHDDDAATVRQIAQDIIGGKSLRQIARELTARKIPTGWTRKGIANTHWAAGPLVRMLRSKALLGYMPHNFRKDGSYDLVRGEDGQLLRREPILDDDTWHALQIALERPGQASRVGQRSDASPLLDVGFCGKCSAKLYRNRFTSHGTAYAYYVCSGECGAPAVKCADLDAYVSADMARDATPVQERRIERGSNHETELEINQESQANLLAIQDEISEDEFDSRMAELRADRKRLLSLPTTPSRIYWIQTGQSNAHKWASLTTDQERRKMLLDGGIKVYSPAVKGEAPRIERPELKATVSEQADTTLAPAALERTWEDLS